MYKKRFYKIFNYCEDNNIKVVFHDRKEDLCYPRTSLICINKNQPWRKRLYALLHEVGHVKIYRNKESWSKDFSVFTTDCHDGRKYRSLKYQVSLIAEEIDAWRIGRQIAEDCNVYLDIEDYHNIMNKCVFTYIKDAPRVIYS